MASAATVFECVLSGKTNRRWANTSRSQAAGSIHNRDASREGEKRIGSPRTTYRPTQDGIVNGAASEENQALKPAHKKAALGIPSIHDGRGRAQKESSWDRNLACGRKDSTIGKELLAHWGRVARTVEKRGEQRSLRCRTTLEESAVLEGLAKHPTR